MLLICLGCTAAYSVGAPRCPQCGGTDHVEQGSAEHLALSAPAPVKAKAKPSGAADADK